MRKLILLLSILLLIPSISGCTAGTQQAQIAATTLPVYEFTSRLCSGTGISVTRLVTESVSCLHDYSLNVRQVKAAEAAQVIVQSGAGLEDFLDGIGQKAGTIIDASNGIGLLESGSPDHGHEHEHKEDEHHHHEHDPHIWLSPEKAAAMVRNICAGLKQQYPQYADQFEKNLHLLLSDLDALQAYGESELAELSCRELVTFHDGFAYFAQAFDLTILEAVEEESGSEASASELKHLIGIVREHSLPAVFTECNGTVSSADVIAAETGAAVFPLDMAMAGDSYFDAMYHNIDTIKEALG